MTAREYTRDLVAFPTVSTSSNTAICTYLEDVMKRLGFGTERITYLDAEGVEKVNVVGRKGSGTGGMAYFGHTDVVPADSWFSSDHGPFEPVVKGDRLFGRGSCDMKGSLGAMLAAVEGVAESDLEQPLYLVFTADEEIGYGGAEQVALRSGFFREMVEGDARGIVGEPTLLKRRSRPQGDVRISGDIVRQGCPFQHERGHQRQPGNDSVSRRDEADPR